MIELNDVLDALADDIRQVLRRHGRDNPALVGIHTGGVWVAEALAGRLGLDGPMGTLDIAFYRDDFSRIGMHPRVKPSDLPFDVDDRHLILVDDVLYTGRTIRAALNSLFDFGRPASVTLAVLVDRGQRELPIAPDATGMTLDLSASDRVKLRGPDPLALDIVYAP